MKTIKLAFPLSFIIITCLSFYLRFNNYQNLVNFHLDPPFYMSEVKDMVDSGKIRLVGPLVTSKVVEGRGFFIGPLMYYIIAVAGFASNWSITLITSLFTFSWILAFGIMFFWFRKKFGLSIALLLYALFSFLPYFLPLSRMMWNPHFIPVCGFIFLLFLDNRGKSRFFYFLAGFFWGLGLNFHYSAILWLIVVLPVLIWEIKKSKFRIGNWLVLLGGLMLANTPLLLFDLRHNFYSLKTFIFQLQYGKISAGYTFALQYYFSFPVVPVAAYSIAWILRRIQLVNSQLFKAVFLVGVITAVFLFLLSLGPSGQQPIYPQGWNLATQQKVVNLIISDKEKDFEVAEIINSDTRALDLRWWLRMKNIPVMKVDEYDKAKVLYLVAPYNRLPENETVWEINSLRPFEQIFKKDIGDNIILYKLVNTSRY